MQTQLIYEEVAKDFVEKALDRAGYYLEGILLYGSVAREEANEESDIDLLILTKDIPKVKPILDEIRTELDLKHGTLTTLIYRTVDQVKKSIQEGNPFILEVLKEGKWLYERGILKKIGEELLEAGK